MKAPLRVYAGIGVFLLASCLELFAQWRTCKEDDESVLEAEAQTLTDSIRHSMSW